MIRIRFASESSASSQSCGFKMLQFPDLQVPSPQFPLELDVTEQMVPFGFKFGEHSPVATSQIPKQLGKLENWSTVVVAHIWCAASHSKAQVSSVKQRNTLILPPVVRGLVVKGEVVKGLVVNGEVVISPEVKSPDVISKKDKLI